MSLPPIPEDIDRELAELIDRRGLRRAIAAHANLSPETVTRWLNPYDHACPSPVAQVLRVLYGLRCAAPDVEAEVWALLRRERSAWDAAHDATALVSELLDKTRRNADSTTAIITALADGQISPTERAELRRCLVRERAAIDRLQDLLGVDGPSQLRAV